MINEGKITAMDSLKQLLQKCQGDFTTNEFGEKVTDNIYELLAVVSDDNRFQFNIPTLSREVYGIGRGEFGVIAAYSNVGKTAFAISLCAAPSGFCQQGAKVVYIANEEIGKRTKLRAIQSYTGMTRDEISETPEDAAARYSGIKDRLIFQDAQGWDITTLEAYLAQEKADVVIVDMADKIALTEKFNSGHERLRELYYRLREAAKTYDCAVLGLSQASAEAEGKTRITMSMMEGSKLGKAAESDIMLGLGKMDSPDDPDDSTRWITVMKNKISGWHGTVMVNLDVDRNRYVA
jgi:predicted ATP-dependent serine protease